MQRFFFHWDQKYANNISAVQSLQCKTNFLIGIFTENWFIRDVLTNIDKPKTKDQNTKNTRDIKNYYG